jgi:hypothetical protein
MQLTWRTKRAGEIEYGLIFGSIAVVALCAVAVLPLPAMLPACSFRSFTGLACPTCGSTRALASLARGEVLASASLNPLFSSLVIASTLALLLNGTLIIFRLPRPSLHLRPFEAACIRGLAVLLVLANWAYVAFRLS